MRKDIISTTPLIIIAGIAIGLFVVWLGGSLHFFTPKEGSQFNRGEQIERTEALVTEVIDGDTVVISAGNFVRLIGIDAPEEGEAYSSEARNALAEFVGNRRVILEKDQSERDQHGRLLRYVYVDGISVNETMVQEGYARALIIPPDTRYARILQDAQNQARSANRGMWQD